MKYFILFISAILLCSCSSSSSDVSVDKFMYDGHSYLLIDSYNDYGFEVLHDPNCKCLTLK